MIHIFFWRENIKADLFPDMKISKLIPSQFLHLTYLRMARAASECECKNRFS